VSSGDEESKAASREAFTLAPVSSQTSQNSLIVEEKPLRVKFK
jgi:hypothetical protein